MRNIRIIPNLAKVSSIENSIKLRLGGTSRVVIDFSSPNIAKPFHFGHLKSTILGNFLANIHQFYGHEVTRLNFIGDWGTQYGLLSLGLDDDKKADEVFECASERRSILERLVDIYVEANNRGKEDENFYRMARERFKLMDFDQDAEQLYRWRRIRDLSLNELKHSYEQLGIQFDVYDYESDYARASIDLVEQMKARGLVRRKRRIDNSDPSSEDLWVVEVMKNNKCHEVPLLKSDGTSLYLTRDVAASINRQSMYNFDKLLYVVGADQERHFHYLREITKKVVEQNWAENLLHIKVGKVVGMSSRSGNFVLLSKIIDEATDRFIESTINSPTSKVFIESDIHEVGRHLAISSLFTYDMRNKRTRNYEFDWDQVMAPTNRSGLQIQASYARLCSLRRKSIHERGWDVYDSSDEIDYSERVLSTNQSNDAIELIECLNEFLAYLDTAYSESDPSHLVNYAFRLCKLTNRARRNDSLQVIKEPDDSVARSRLTLFDCSREQLKFIIKLIGLKPLPRV